MKTNQKKAGIEKIKATIKELGDSGVKTTQSNVAQTLGISRQSVSKTLAYNNESNEKYRLTEDELAMFVGQLKSMDTATKTITELKEIVGYPRTAQSFYKLLCKHEIPFDDSRFASAQRSKARPGGTRHKLINLKEDVSNLTIQQLHKLIDCQTSIRSLRVICYRNNIEYKKLSNHKGGKKNV
ncbi:MULTISPECIES: hypothetical protein [Burkholderia cepacia complex]|uniref:hypothetical protein n=1 Tax=Burkholderia cepacia complex TaxID=87882 RepID=UPI00209DA318|nr:MULTISPECIES: hypothetical protein [Burkholderia cepacia complex]MCO8393906.1 hypothetical protein [Burkholderia cenocepacia]MCO8402262.1 hypothetical protein [Burkholderia cenocepacia]MCO8416323.1 hypothetical protein [Burkholderia cenocepacia]MCO8444759.1 hypothetical protein [Burkholderia cenocepacia]MCO8455005.1 hypothetical protein [Burkholderia multivorans]